jgi:serine/threonine protein kinase
VTGDLLNSSDLPPPLLSSEENTAEFQAPKGPIDPVADRLDRSSHPTLPTSLQESPIGPAVAAALVGQIFDDFEILEEIGRGGMGVVYKARQISLDRIVALKMLLGDYFQKPIRLQRFLGEARAAASLTHTNIVGIYQVGECIAGHFFVMEYLDGPALDALLEERRAPIAWAVSLLIPVADAVHYAHTKGIVHRDLKPSNIMIDRKRRPVVMDFGLAKFVGQPSTLTHEGVLMGTPAYMSPEQAQDDKGAVGPLSDVYGLGAILYHLLTGQPPFHESTALKTVMKVVSPELPSRVRDLRLEVPAKLEHICMKCLRKEPERRYASAHMVAKRLRQVYASLSRQPSSSSGKNPLPSAVLLASETGNEVRLFLGTSLIGRASDCDIIIRAADVSKHHCHVILDFDELLVEDLGSANGISVNGCIVDRANLLDGDELEIASHKFRVKRQRPEIST